MLRQLVAVDSPQRALFANHKEHEIAQFIGTQRVDQRWWLSWSYALRREKTIEAAQAVLLKGAEIHPDVGLIAYNLACYSCVMRDLVEARVLLRKAFILDKEFKVMALNDPDLEPLWGELGNE